MNDKMKACMNSHVFMHSVFGFGIGLIVAVIVIGNVGSHTALLVAGIVLAALAFMADAMRKQ